MKKHKIHWTKALELLKNNISVQQNEIEINEKIHISNVIEFNKHNINIPEHFINYDDETIDCSDIPEITEEAIKAGKLIKVMTAKIKMNKETENWIKKSNINYNELLSNLLNNFHQSVTSLQKNAAF